MKRPLHLILDSHLNPGVSLFWWKHGLRVMEQLVPNEFANTSSRQSLEKLMEQSVWSGWKKVILIGTNASIQRGFNVLMQSNDACRNSLEVGFWPLKLSELSLQMLPQISQLGSILQVFKAGHTLPMDVIKLQCLTPELKTSFFWNGLKIKCRNSEADTHYFLNDKDVQHSGGFDCKIDFQETELSSLMMIPDNLGKAVKMRVYLRPRNHTSSIILKKTGFFSKNQLEMLIGSCRHLEIEGNWANLEINDPELREPVQSVNLEIIRRAIPLIIPAIPLRHHETLKSKFFQLEPRRGVATQIQNVSRRKDNRI
jgi:hypothetical protein